MYEYIFTIIKFIKKQILKSLLLEFTNLICNIYYLAYVDLACVDLADFCGLIVNVLKVHI